MLRAGWTRILVVASLVGIIALVSNVTTTAQLAGEADGVLTLRFTVSKLVNSGTVWGGLLILAGWLVRRPRHAALAGVIAGEVALMVHYGLGHAFAIHQGDIWRSNWYWFIAPLILGIPLGLIGAMARREDLRGLAAQLVVPVAAIIEPLSLGMLSPPEILPPPARISSIACGVILIALGLLGAVIVGVRRRPSTRPAQRPPFQATGTDA